MNCAEVDRILDSHGPAALASKHQRAVDEHLATCRDCRDAWAAYRALTAERVPVTPPRLRQRVVSALLAARQAQPRTARSGRFALGIALVAGAAAASTWVYRAFEDEGPVSSVVVDSGRASAAAPSADTVVAAAPVVTSPNTQPPNDEAREPRVAPLASALPLDAYSVVVLAMPSPTISQEAAGYFEQCHEDVLRELRTVDGLNVIADAQVAPYSGSRRPPEEIGRELGAGSVLALSTEFAFAMPDARREPKPSLGSCHAELIDAQTSAVLTGAGRNSSPWTADKSREFAWDVARVVRDAVLGDRSAIARAQAAVLNLEGGLGGRVTSLGFLRRGRLYVEHLDIDERQGMAPEPIPGAFTEAVVAAAVNIGSTAPDATARLYAWRYLRGVRNPSLTQALLSSLVSDADARVRCQAALTLGYLVDEPGVRSALMRAGVEDPSTEPPTKGGCMLSVRAAAQRALNSDDELRAASLRTLLDTTLPSLSRLAPLFESIDGRGLPTELDITAAQAVFEIGRESQDAQIRALAWESLASFALPAFMPTLIEDLAKHASDNVRATAAAALAPYAGEVQVRAALEQAGVDPSLVVRRAAQLALETARAE